MHGEHRGRASLFWSICAEYTVFLIWDPSLPSFFICCLLILICFSKTSIFLKVHMSPFFPPTPTEKTGNIRCRMSWFAPLHSTDTSCELFSLACHLRGAPLPFVCWIPSLLTHPGPVSLTENGSPHTFLPGLWTMSIFPSLGQPTRRSVLGQRDNECIGKKELRNPERKTWDAYPSAFISKCSNLKKNFKECSNIYKTCNRAPTFTMGQVTRVTG